MIQKSREVKESYLFLFFFNRAFASWVRSKTCALVTAVCDMLFQMTVPYNFINVAI